MTISRRQFLRTLAFAAPVAAVAPAVAAELAELLTPKPKIFLPPVGGWCIYSDIAEIVRKGFVPKLVVQIYNSSPLTKAMLSQRAEWVEENEPLRFHGVPIVWDHPVPA